MIEEIAKELDGREYPFRLSDAEEEKLESFGIVVVVGYSDDIMSFQGAISEEIGAYNGGVAYLDENGLIENKCDDGECPYFKEKQRTGVPLEALWGHSGRSWTVRAEINHKKFIVMEDGEEYCEGIVFSLSDLKEAVAKKGAGND